jgi:cell division protease FtsH
VKRSAITPKQFPVVGDQLESTANPPDPGDPRPRGAAGRRRRPRRGRLGHPGHGRAELANLVNEAAILAARRSHDAIHQADFTDALEKIVLGRQRRILLSPDQRRRIAYYEGGHALLGMLTPGADPVRKISIVPRPRPRGHLPVSRRRPLTPTASYLRGRIAGMLAGLAAEELVQSDVTTGAENDLEQATGLAKRWWAAGACPRR